MKTVHKSVLIWFSAEEMFALVTDVASYPKFLPWCDKAAVLSETGTAMKAEIGIAFGGIHQTFTTLNEHVPGREVRMQHDKILILDFGSQVTQLIARRVREAHGDNPSRCGRGHGDRQGDRL